jgi:hypothetical protein
MPGTPRPCARRRESEHYETDKHRVDKNLRRVSDGDSDIPF